MNDWALIIFIVLCRCVVGASIHPFFFVEEICCSLGFKGSFLSVNIHILENLADSNHQFSTQKSRRSGSSGIKEYLNHTSL